ncbi:MAG: hypothetical protein HYU39_11020 [Thaumarchaeota archaeon]|nr:hypothetical protein [Nitrososphaerota archaeon]
MAKCEICGAEEDLPFVCNYCNATLCAEHRLPEAHRCQKLWKVRLKKPQVLRPAPRPTYTARRRQLRIPTDLKHLFIAWVVLGLAFSARYMFRAPSIFGLMLGVSLGTVGLGFILHELAHKFASKRYGCWAEFRISPWGLTMALIFAFISGGSFIFAAPGATYIVPGVSKYAHGLTRRENGLISLAGPLTNLAVAAAFQVLSRSEGLLGLVGLVGYQVNLWLAAFNLIPLGGMDGRKILSWSLPVWLVVTIPLWILVALQLLL